MVFLVCQVSRNRDVYVRGSEERMVHLVCVYEERMESLDTFLQF